MSSHQRALLVVAVMMAVFVTVILVSLTWSGSDDEVDADWVDIGNNVGKTCDGSNLVYARYTSSGGVAVVPNAEECL